MKRKHYGILGLGMILLSAVLTTVVGQSNYDTGEKDKPVSFQTQFHEVNVPGTASLKDMKRIVRKMKSLSTPPQNDNKSVNLRLFGYSPEEGIYVSSDGAVETGPVYMDYTLTYSFSSKTKKFCIINGTLFREGERLEDGAKILQIEINRVLMQKRNRKKWIYTDNNGRG